MRRKTADDKLPIERYTVMSQAEVAELLGVSVMAVSLVERRALAKLKVAFPREWKRRGLRRVFAEWTPTVIPR